MGLTDEQIKQFDQQYPGWRDAYRLGHAAGVAAERKRIMSVLAKMIDGDSSSWDQAITTAMKEIERGEDA